VLLISGAMPELPRHLAPLAALVTLSVLEASHFLSSLVGAALLLVARGIQRRLDTAFWATVACLCAGMVFSLLKDLGYREALLLGLVLAALLPARGLFWRKGPLISGSLSSGWMAATVAVLASSAWIVAFAGKNEIYSAQLWWRFLLTDSVPRSLRAIRMGGTVAQVGVLSGAAEPLAIPSILHKQARIQGIYVGSRQNFVDLNKAISLTGMRPVGENFPWFQAREVLSRMEEGSHFGKLVLTVA